MAKAIENLTDGLSAVFKSIYELKKQINKDGKSKSGIVYERSLISDNLIKESFTEDEQKFLENLIYPKKSNEFEVDDAFGIFIWMIHQRN